MKVSVLRLLPVFALVLAACTTPPPPPPPSEPLEATDDLGVTPAGSVLLAPGEDANFNLVLGDVRGSFDVIVAELVTPQDAAIELRNGAYWGVIASSDTPDYFVSGTLENVPAASVEGGLSPQDVASPALLCQGPCVLFAPGAANFYLRVVNTGATVLDADVYLYGYDLDDQNEPANNDRSTAAVIVEGESGALELLGDVDYWRATTSGDITVSNPTGIDIEVSVFDKCGLAVAGPYAGNETFGVFEGEAIRVRAVDGAAAASGRSQYFLVVDPFSGAPRNPGCQEAVAGTNPAAPVGSATLGGSQTATFLVSVPTTVRSRDVLQFEVSRDVLLEVYETLGGPVLYSATSGTAFTSGPGGASAAGAVAPAAVEVGRACSGSCVIIADPGASYVVKVRNTGGAGSIDLYAFGRDYDDTEEPSNDSRANAPVLTGADSGAIETVGDVDFWRSTVTGTVTFSTVTNGLEMVADVYDELGRKVATLLPNMELLLVDGDYLVVRAADPDEAAVSGRSQYWLD